MSGMVDVLIERLIIRGNAGVFESFDYSEINYNHISDNQDMKEIKDMKISSQNSD
jgi:hypothetical protein